MTTAAKAAAVAKTAAATKAAEAAAAANTQLKVEAAATAQPAAKPAPEVAAVAAAKPSPVADIIATLAADTPKKKSPAKKPPTPPRPGSLLQLDVDLERSWTTALAAGASTVDIAKTLKKYSGARSAAEKAQVEA